tara:strand:+ start:486 stop:1445 length:960 start_codon:yes stop_codon:yes gene_type:complete
VTHPIDYSELELQFSDDFKEVGPVDRTRWAKLEHADLDVWTEDPAESRRQGWQEGLLMNAERSGMHQVEVLSEGGCASVEATTTRPAGPAVMAYGGLVTKDKQFAPGLQGTSLLEIVLSDYVSDGEYLNKWLTYYGNPGDVEDPVGGRYEMGWGLAIGSFGGFMTGREEGVKDRAVQLHFDGWSKYGWTSILCRNIVPGDEAKYPGFDSKTETYVAKPKPFIAQPCVILASGLDLKAGRSGSFGHRYGLGLSDNANTVFWTLNGQVMDRVDITGFFGSEPAAMKDGAYASICMGGSYQRNVWRYSEARIYVGTEIRWRI